MFKDIVSFYLGEEKKGGFSTVIAQDGFFLCLEIYSGLDNDQGYKIVESIKTKIKQKLTTEKYLINNLSEFDDFISSIVTENNFPTGFSLASGYLKENILYLKTINEGKIFIRRKGKYGLLLYADNTASGEIEDEDFFIFTTDNFLNLIGGRVKIEEIFADKKPKEIVDEITPFIKNKNDQGAVAIMVEFLKQKVYQEEIEEGIEREYKTNIFSSLKTYFIAMRNSQKTLTVIMAVFLFGLLLWSMTLGVKRKNSLLIEEKYKKVNELINQKLETAQEVAFLNMDRALILLQESKEELNKLKTEAENLKVKNNKITDLEKKINEVENKIVKKELANYREFFDLTVDDKEAEGEKMILSENNVYILNKKKGVIYNLSLDKKSLEKSEFSEIKSANLLTSYESRIYFYVKDVGVYEIVDKNKPKKVIDKDKDWGEIIDLSVYNGNLYLLDKEKDEIWKYLKTDNGFGNKTSYFQKGEAINLSEINSFAIDGSIYLSGNNLILKYTSGTKESFKYDLPSNKFNFFKVFTNKNLEKIYLWDKNSGVVYVLGKTGEYVSQLNSDIFQKGNDFVVYKDEIYLLLKNKIFIVK